MSFPLFSIIVPIYKVRKEYLDHCIRSIMEQSEGDFELILVDDGSPDDSGKYCDDYAKNDVRIRVIHQENQGVSMARNHGIEAAKGEWIMFVDADDWVEKNTCEVVKNYIAHFSFDILHFSAVREYSHKSIVMNYGLKYNEAYFLGNVDDREYLYHRIMKVPKSKNDYATMHYSWDKVFRRDLLLNNAIRYPKGIKRSEDKLFFLSCLQHADKYMCVSDVLYHYRMNEESVCHSFSNDIDDDRRAMLKLLEPIVHAMDYELGLLKKDFTYHKLHDAYSQLVFSMIADILRFKYYHREYEPHKSRKTDVILFLNTEPFSSAIAKADIFKMSAKSRLKLYLLKYKCIYTHMLLYKVLDVGRKSI